MKKKKGLLTTTFVRSIGILNHNHEIIASQLRYFRSVFGIDTNYKNANLNANHKILRTAFLVT